MSAPIHDEDWRGLPSGIAHSGESTSAALRRTQEALAASQADLTHVEHQLREAEAERMRAERERAETAEWWRSELRLVEAELATARAELDRLRKAVRGAAASTDWIVARDGGRSCARCEHEIRRGEAYAYLSDTDELTHIHCPDREGEKP